MYSRASKTAFNIKSGVFKILKIRFHEVKGDLKTSNAQINPTQWQSLTVL